MLEVIASVIARERMESWFAEARPRAGGGAVPAPARRPRTGARARAAAALRRAADRLEPAAEPRPASVR
jgi:hypothetical protein